MCFSFFVQEHSVAGLKLTQELQYKDIRRQHILHGALAKVLRGKSLASTLVRPTAFHCASSRIPFPNLASRHRAVHRQTARLASSVLLGFFGGFALQFARSSNCKCQRDSHITHRRRRTLQRLRLRLSFPFALGKVQGGALQVLTGCA